MIHHATRRPHAQKDVHSPIANGSTLFEILFKLIQIACFWFLLSSIFRKTTYWTSFDRLLLKALANFGYMAPN